MKIVNLLIFTFLLTTLSSCCEFVEEIRTIGPFTIVCEETYQTYDKTQNQLANLRSRLDAAGIIYNMPLAIFYERYGSGKFHSIIGFTLPPTTSTDNETLIKLERNGFNVRTIGHTNCYTIATQNDVFGSGLRTKIIGKIDKYCNENNYKLLPNSEDGIIEIYKDDRVLFCVELKPVN